MFKKLVKMNCINSLIATKIYCIDTCNISKIKSFVTQKKIFNYIGLDKTLKIINYNKSLQQKIGYNINDYFVQSNRIIIDIHKTPVTYGTFMNNICDTKEGKTPKLLSKIYFDDKLTNKNEFKVNKNEQNVKKITVVIYPNVNVYSVYNKKKKIPNISIKFASLFYKHINIEDNIIIKKIDFKKIGKIYKISTMSSMFEYRNDLKTITGLEKIDTSNVSALTKLFNNCTALEKISGINTWDTSNVTDMKFMFCSCHILEEIDVSNFNTSKVQSFQSFFDYCYNLKSIKGIEKWDTSNLKNCSFMFRNCALLRDIPDISNWNTPKLEDIHSMFQYCSALEHLPNIFKWNTGNLKNITFIFSNCNSLKTIDGADQNIPCNWNISNVVSCYKIFNKCNNLQRLPNISTLDTSNVELLTAAFQYCESLTEVPDLSNWDLRKLRYALYMFQGCKNLTHIPNINFPNGCKIDYAFGGIEE